MHRAFCFRFRLVLAAQTHPPTAKKQVSPRFPSSELREEEEDRVYRVFVAPGPSYMTAVRNACVEHPFSGVAFSYIVPAGGGQGGGGGAPVPSIVAHDVGAVGVAGGAGGRAGEELVYVIVVNAVDAIRAVEVGALCVLVVES